MATQTASSGTTIRMRRTFSASREKVRRAWTELAALNHWMCRDVQWHPVRYLGLDVRPNGRYEIEVKMPEGVSYIGGGIYREVKPPEKFSFRWPMVCGAGNCADEGRGECAVLFQDAI